MAVWFPEVYLLVDLFEKPVHNAARHFSCLTSKNGFHSISLEKISVLDCIPRCKIIKYRCRVKRFWQDLRQWLLSVPNITLIMEEKSILFSYQGKNQLVNYILTLAKHHIYITKFFANELDVNIFIVILNGV